jgi:4-hydroxybenzoate polyprenyltransferase
LKYINQFLSFFVYSNLFIAICAVLMVDQSFHLLLHTKADPWFTAFVFFSTLCSYSFHWYLTSGSVIPSARIHWMEKYKIIHILFFFTGLAGSIVFFFYIRSQWLWLSVAALATFLYSAPKIPHPWFRVLRKVALGKTIFLALVWMYVTTMLPVIIAGNEWNSGIILFSVYRFFQVYALCIIFDYRDRADDKAAGIRSLITFLSEKGIARVFSGSLVIAAAAALLMLNYNYSIIDIVILLIPCTITALLYNHARRNFGDMFYYLIMDGLVALSAILMLVARI